MHRLVLALLLLGTTARAATVTGRVVQDGFRVAEYAVYVDPAHPIAIRDGDGRFAIEVPAGQRRLTIAGWAFARREIALDVPETLATVALGTITVDRGRTLTGRVVDAAGTLVAGATVAVYETRTFDLAASELELLASGAQVATTGHDGTFTVNGLPETVEGLHALAFGDDLASPERILGRDTWSIELPLGKRGTIAGRVTNRRRMSAPIVTARPAGFPGKPMLAGVDPHGRFRLELPAGVYELGFLDEPAAAPLQVVVVGDRTRAVTLTAPTSHDTLEITADCSYVRLLGARPGAKRPRTEVAFEICESNRALFTRLPPGSYAVCIDTEDEAACKPLRLRASPTRVRF